MLEEGNKVIEDNIEEMELPLIALEKWDLFLKIVQKFTSFSSSISIEGKNLVLNIIMNLKGTRKNESVL